MPALTFSNKQFWPLAARYVPHELMAVALKEPTFDELRKRASELLHITVAMIRRISVRIGTMEVAIQDDSSVQFLSALWAKVQIYLNPRLANFLAFCLMCNAV